MTSYHGGKQRIGKRISELIMQQTHASNLPRRGNKYKGYCEPFSGMCGVSQHIPANAFRAHLAGDINKSVIMMWHKLQQGWSPPVKCTRERFFKLKGNGKSSAEKGFVGHVYGFRGIYFVTFKDRDIDSSRRKVKALATGPLHHVVFAHGEYTQFSHLRGYAIYCDPPYANHSNFMDEFNHIIPMDHVAFYKWAENMSIYNLVFISERINLPYTLLEEFPNSEKLYVI